MVKCIHEFVIGIKIYYYSSRSFLENALQVTTLSCIGKM
jgi:hypothetical protein